MMDCDNAQRCVILAADDNDDDIELMRFLFAKAGVTHPVEVYRRGEELIQVLTGLMAAQGEAALPLVCFLDVKMPSISGHELLRWIREQPQLEGLAVVMLSSSEHPQDVRQAAEGGAQCYLAKYPQAEVLKQVLDEAGRQSSHGVDARREWFRLPDNLLLGCGVSQPDV